MNTDPFEVLEGDQRVCLIEGDVLAALSWLPDACADFVFMDVPYGLGSHEPTPGEILAYLFGDRLSTGGDFMGEKWEIPSIAVWGEVVRVARPGCHVFSYASPKTLDLISMGMRMAGLESRNCLQWLQAQGSPKGIGSLGKAIDKKFGAVREVVGTRTLSGTAALSIEEKGGTFSVGVSSVGAKKEVDITVPRTPEVVQWEGHATGLAPMWEPILVFRKPCEGTTVDNVLRHGIGALNINGCRVQPSNNWPPNVLFTAGESGDTSCPVVELDRQSGVRKSGARSAGVRKGMGFGGAKGDGGPAIAASQGGASRFYPVFQPEEPDKLVTFMFEPKASRIEREIGCERLPPVQNTKLSGRKEGSAGQNHPSCGVRRRGEIRNAGKCVKPINLSRWLARLGGRPEGVALVLYAGTGSEMIGCALEGMRVIGVELDPAMIKIAEARFAWWTDHPGGISGDAKAQHKLELLGQSALFRERK